MNLRPKIKKKTLFWIGGVLVILFIALSYLGSWAKNAFPNYLKQKNDTAYEIQVQDIDFSIFGGNLILKGISIFPKKDSINNLDVDFKLDVEKIKIVNVNVIELIRNKKLDARKIMIYKPDIYYYNIDKKIEKPKTNKPKTEFQNTVNISTFSLVDADLHYMDKDRKTLIASVEKLNIEFKGVELDKKTIEKKIPFSFSSYKIDCRSFYYKINPSQEMTSKELKVTKNEVILSHFSIGSVDSLAVIHSIENDYRLLPRVDSKEFRISDMDWGFSKENKFYFKSSKINFDSARIKIYENLNPTKKEKKLGYLIPFKLNVGDIWVNDAEIELENSMKISNIELKIGSVATDKDQVLKIDSILLDHPVIGLLGKKRPKVAAKGEEEILVSPFRENIELKKLNIKNASIVQFDSVDKNKTPLSLKVNLNLEEIELRPKENYNKQLLNDNFIIKAKSLSFSTNQLSLPKKQGGGDPTNKGNPLVPVNLEIDQIDLQAESISQNNEFLIKPVRLSIQQLKNELEGKLNADLIRISSPQITAYSKQKKKTKSNSQKNQLPNNIEVGRFEVVDANLSLLDTGKKEMLGMKNINFAINQLNTIKQSDLPFLYTNLSLTASSVTYRPKGVYDMFVSNLNFNNKNLRLSKFELRPRMNKAQFVRSLKKEKDYYEIKIADINILNPGFNTSGSDFFLKIRQITMSGMDAYVYRSKIPPDDTSRKKMFSQMLRELKFGLEVRQLNIRNSKLIYEEETEKSSGAGRLAFGNFNATITNINSGFRKRSLPDLRVKLNTTFMNDARLDLDWTFNPMNRNDQFNVKGNVYNFNAVRMTPFIRPYMHVTAEGNISRVYFNFNGNRNTADGYFKIEHNNLKVTVYNPKTGKPRKVVSTLGNLAVKSNTKGQLREVEIKTVSRNQEKSFFNLLWLCVAQGLRQTVLII